MGAVAQTDQERWDERYAATARDGSAATFLRSIEAQLPTSGCALDIAGGTGNNALWLAERGFATTVADVSPVGMAVAQERAQAKGLTIETIRVDFEAEPPPNGPWDLIVCFNYLQRALYERLAARLAPGGYLVVGHPTRKNLERNPRPSARFLLDEGELPSLVSGLDLLLYDEGWFEGRHEARLLARGPCGSSR